ncbi:MAG: hypothetical protein GY772_26515, partial [bacterium]|nr:hypothetical protein [bacterium]
MDSARAPSVAAEEDADVVTVAAPATDADRGLTRCGFGCGPLFRIGGEVVNVGTKKSPKYEGHPCHMAKRALEGQCRGDEYAKG